MKIKYKSCDGESIIEEEIEKIEFYDNEIQLDWIKKECSHYQSIWEFKE